MGDHEQLGLVAIASVDAYDNGCIKIHEYTRPDKEEDRVKHMVELGAQVGPVFLTCKENPTLTRLMNKVTENNPEYNFMDECDVRHTFWAIQNREQIESIESTFEEVRSLYVADGHHRSAAAARARERYKHENKEHTGSESYNYFLVVIFPHSQMKVLDYNRVLKDLNGMSAEQFISAIETDFIVEEVISENDGHPQLLNKRNHSYFLNISN